MLYTKRRFAAELLTELERDLAEAEPPFSPVRLGQWASKQHFKYIGRFEEGLETQILTISLMEEGLEFELNMQQIRLLCLALLSDNY